jgi:SPP1 gp7 family putative phage head morphogenesis protein
MSTTGTIPRHEHTHEHDETSEYSTESRVVPEGYEPEDERADLVARRLTAQQGFPHGSDDPTGTKRLRERYEGEMYRRFRTLKGVIRDAVVERDIFALRDETLRRNDENEREASFQRDADININPPERRAYDFPADARKVEAFNEWLQTQVDRGILERAEHTRGGRGVGRTVAASRSWQQTYIRNAYRKGVEHADQALVNEGIASQDEVAADVFNAPRHVDAAGLAYTRAFRELDGVTSAMGQQISRELAEGLTQGDNPREIARRINGRVDAVGIHRGRLIARTETVRAHNEGALNRYEDFRARLDGVTAKVEHVTAGDLRVCPECAILAGRVLDIEDARGLIPVHPACRCSWLPISTTTGA